MNAAIEVMNHPGGRHGFDVLDPDARSLEIIEHAFAFIKSHLAAPATQFQANSR
jgi:hypothetical protein